MRPQQFTLTVYTAPDAPQPPVCLQPESWTDCGCFLAGLQCREGVWQLTLQAKRQEQPPLCEVHLQVCLPEAFWNDRLLFYHNGGHTNDFTGVQRWAENRQKRTRDLLALYQPDTGEVFGMGQVTAYRFYTELGFGTHCLEQITDLENKPLHPGESYTLERFFLSAPEATGDPQADTQAFLTRYADTVAALNAAVPLAQPPMGWCSWSCYYAAVDEKKLGRAARHTAEALSGAQPGLLQIDDGWQQGGSFPGKYEPDAAKFPHGLLATAENVHEKGMQFGLWLAPLLICEGSPFYEELCPMVNTAAVTLENGGRPVHPFDQESPQFLQYLYDSFVRLTAQYGVQYYKLDFLAASFQRFTAPGGRVYGKSDYCVALFRRVLQTIRRAVGPQVTLLTCGAPMLESAGIFNAARTSCDIIWGKNPTFPTYWSIMKQATDTVLHRGFYHGRVFCNDPDGLVMRDWDNGDGFDCTWSEARLWATAVAASGGSVLVNEELENLSPARRRLFTAQLPPLDMAATPCDYFQSPCRDAVIPYRGDLRFAVRFHWEDTMQDGCFATAAFGLPQALVIRCWDSCVLGVTDTVQEPNRLPHSAELYLLRRVPQAPCFLYAEGHLFCGVGLYEATVRDGRWQVEESERARGLTGALYGWIPQGQPLVGEPVSTVSGGTVVRIRPAKGEKS